MTKTTFTNMNRRIFGATLSALVLSAMSLAVPAASAKDGKDDGPNSRSRTSLSGAAISGKTANGHAEFHAEPSRSRTRLHVELEDVNLTPGTVLSVVVEHAGASTTVGTITLDEFQFGELELNSQDGDTVPAIVPGDMVTVMNGNSKILSGVL